MTTRWLVSLLFAVPLAAQEYSSPIRITGFHRGAALLTWSNAACANNPIYRVLRSTTVTGDWQHFFFITNATSTTLTNSLATDGGAVFHKLEWLGEAPITFDYLFDEGYGAGPCISGQLQLTLPCGGTAIGAWQLAETGVCIDGAHPVGSGSFYRGVLRTNTTPHSIELFFGPGPEGEFLRGNMQTTVQDGQPRYTGISGVVYLRGFAGDTEIGTFAATRAP